MSGRQLSAIRKRWEKVAAQEPESVKKILKLSSFDEELPHDVTVLCHIFRTDEIRGDKGAKIKACMH